MRRMGKKYWLVRTKGSIHTVSGASKHAGWNQDPQTLPPSSPCPSGRLCGPSSAFTFLLPIPGPVPHLDVIVEDHVVVAVSLQQLERMVGGEVLKLQHRVGPPRHDG